MKKLLTFCLFFSSISLLHAQDVKITITNLIAANGTETWFCRSIDGNPENYVVKYDKAVFENGSLSKSFYIDTTMFIMIADNPYVPKIRLVVCKGDSVNINIKSDTISHVTKVSFAGNNADGHENYYNNSLFLAGKTQAEVYEMLKTCINYEDAIYKLEQLKANLFKSMDSLFSLKKITGDYYNYVKLEGDIEFLSSIYNITSTAIYKYDQDRDSFKFKKKEFTQLQKWYFEKYDPFSENYRYTNYRRTASMQKCSLIANRTLSVKTQSYNLNLWDNTNIAYNYAPIEIQEKMFASELIFKQKFGMISDQDTKNGYKRLKAAFPNSVFLPVIEQSFDSEVSNVPAFAFGKYDKSSKVFDYLQQDSSNLTELVKKHFPNQAVMVDLWATWCSPCKKEFAYAKDIQSFLKKYQISLLYISLDNKNNVTGWIDDIGKYALDGYHYIATEGYGMSLSNLLKEDQISIPRYLLFNKDGHLVNKNLPRPSEGNKLYEVILKMLSF